MFQRTTQFLSLKDLLYQARTFSRNEKQRQFEYRLNTGKITGIETVQLVSLTYTTNGTVEMQVQSTPTEGTLMC